MLSYCIIKKPVNSRISDRPTVSIPQVDTVENDHLINSPKDVSDYNDINGINDIFRYFRDFKISIFIFSNSL